MLAETLDHRPEALLRGKKDSGRCAVNRAPCAATPGCHCCARCRPGADGRVRQFPGDQPPPAHRRAGSRADYTLPGYRSASGRCCCRTTWTGCRW
ncbi:MAG: hypothetical protein MZW92_11910 [Comamonadaceae bacterium]|nr:hypothetical protein [Comamonadaceae bacterium]